MVIHVIDTETTGFSSDPTAHVVEVAMVTLVPGRGITGTFSSLVKPPVLTQEGLDTCMKISGITQGEIESAPDPASVKHELLRVIERWGGAVTAWNLAFDRTMIRRTLFGLDELSVLKQMARDEIEQEALLSKYGWPEVLPIAEDPVPWTQWCAMWAYAKQCPDVRGRHQIPLTGTWRNNAWRLEAAAARESVKLEGAHRALVDATATAQILDLMLADRLAPKTEPENQPE